MGVRRWGHDIRHRDFLSATELGWVGFIFVFRSRVGILLSWGVGLQWSFLLEVKVLLEMLS